MKQLLTYKTAAAVADCSPSTIQKACLKGEIPIIKIGNETRIDQDDFEGWLRRKKHFHVRENCSDDNRKQELPTTETTVARS